MKFNNEKEEITRELAKYMCESLYRICNMPDLEDPLDENLLVEIIGINLNEYLVTEYIAKKCKEERNIGRKEERNVARKLARTFVSGIGVDPAEIIWRKANDDEMPESPIDVLFTLKDNPKEIFVGTFNSKNKSFISSNYFKEYDFSKIAYWMPKLEAPLC